MLAHGFIPCHTEAYLIQWASMLIAALPALPYMVAHWGRTLARFTRLFFY